MEVQKMIALVLKLQTTELIIISTIPANTMMVCLIKQQNVMIIIILGLFYF